MSTQLRPNEKLYLYAIVSGLDDTTLGPIGLGGDAVYSITSGRVSAIVSRAPDKVRPERRHLAAHHEVLKHLMANTDAVLPVAFGTVAGGRKALSRILARNQRDVHDTLRRVTGCVEMGLRVTWDLPNIFEHFVETYPELRAARDRLLSGHREPSQDDKIEVGRMFERLLTEDRESHADQVEEILAPACVETKRNAPRTEREAVNLACLVKRDRQEQFEAGVFDVAKLFDNKYAFDYSGPWPPYNFVEMALDLGALRTGRPALSVTPN